MTFRLAQTDHEILRAIAECRIVTAPQLAALLARSAKGVRDRTTKLIAEGLLAEVTRGRGQRRGRPTQTLYRKPFPLRGRPDGLKVYRRVRSQGPPLKMLRQVTVRSYMGEPPTEWFGLEWMEMDEKANLAMGGRMATQTPVRLRRERGNRYGSVEGLSDDELADPDELERVVYMEEYGPILRLPVGGRRHPFYGSIDEDELKFLAGLTKWMDVNSEGIYGTRPWRVFGEGETDSAGEFVNNGRDRPYTGSDIRFGSKGSVLYATLMAWPGQRAVVKSLGRSVSAAKVAEVSLLGHNTPLKWEQTETGLEVAMPVNQPCEHAFVLKIAGENLTTTE